ncbi:thioredoxin domain-containing protein [Candidatus Woesearchaeota archaeon]|jgi:protein-disulfide isomerase/plastocyanin|nr:thioredoxin domain-containing protein [Candidatus Woesearchaeota archaeon]MBT5740638.1 thioredoxin domain-containing protein [Candidatus Woesearchaeota archaeon]
MEQKQLDEMENSFLNEEFIDEKDLAIEEVIIEPAKPKKTAKKVIKKKTAKKAATKKVEKIVEKPKPIVAAEPVKKEEPMKIEPRLSPVTPEPTKPVDPWDDSDEPSSGGMWKALTVILLILFVVSIFTYGFHGNPGETTGTAVSLAEAEQTVLQFVNTQLLQAPFVAEVESTEELNGLYRVTLNVAGDSVDSYITKDGELFFPQGLPLSEVTSDTLSLDPADVETDDDPFLGNSNAPVTIVEFSDFQCSFCKKFHEETFPEIKQKYIDTGKVKLIFRDYPLLDAHPESERAALAAECADDQGLFWEYHNLLFERQSQLGDNKYSSWANELDMDVDAFDVCFNNAIHAGEVERDFAEGEVNGVTGTPGFFINGKLVSGAQPFSVFEQEIESALSLSGVAVIEEPEQPVQVEEPVEVVPTPTPVITGETKEITLQAKRWLFNPQDVTVNKGDHVVLTIKPENLAFTFGLESFDVEEDVDGQTVVEFTADKSGDFVFTCSSCEDWRGMTGMLTVE